MTYYVRGETGLFNLTWFTTDYLGPEGPQEGDQVYVYEERKLLVWRDGAWHETPSD